MKRLGTGIGWRPEIAEDIARLPDIDWVEVVAENICPGHVPDALTALRERGTTVVPHGVSLGLGGAAPPDPARLAALAERAETLAAPLVTEHIAFVRGGGPLTASPEIEAGHLLPVPRTRQALAVLCENVRIAQDALPVPLALENIAALISWPGEELTEGQFLTELVERTGVRLLIDVANLHTNHVNRGEDPARTLDALPTWAIAYVHVAGGVERDGVWHDSHAHPVTQPVLDVLAELCSRATPPGVLLERDEAFPPTAELAAELDAIRAVVATTPTAPTPDRTAPSARRAVAPARALPHLRAVPAPRSPAPTPRPAREPVAAAHGARSAVRPAAPRPASGTGTARATPTAAPTAAAPTAAAPTARPAGHRAAPGVVSDALPAAGPVAAPSAPDAATAGVATPDAGDAERQRLALAQTALLSALVAGTPAPEGFDRGRLRVQSRALVAKRADVVARIAPELPEILGTAYRPAFVAYARHRPLRGGYRRDALAFVERLLATEEFADPVVHRRLAAWWQERSGPAPLSARPAARLLRAARLAWGRKR
ncbi:multinuclear nonheme iron-dependent oxidase [Streptomyces buecherae]|uniref:multinuclear nonheme iron-dependent oxidase n=2 Tax=Streptomyces buecherae TaxID=2763006 RepID=UPI00164D3CFC|nr:DUF692 family multinuclear iron-containing protein [Streptomyces buecherae]QNJ39562.1 DUF692 family protein [Streptomyces buecherae]